MSLFYENPDGSVSIGFEQRGRIGLDNVDYLRMRKCLTDELKEKINIRLQELWKSDKELLISLVRDKKSEQIYNLFGIKDMDNGWFMDKWAKCEKERMRQGRWDTHFEQFKYSCEKIQKEKIEDKKFDLYNLKLEVSPCCGILRQQRLTKYAGSKLTRSFSCSEIGSDVKTREHPFFLEKWGLGEPMKVEIPDFLKTKTMNRPKIDKKRRGGGGF